MYSFLAKVSGIILKIKNKVTCIKKVAFLGVHSLQEWPLNSSIHRHREKKGIRCSLCYTIDMFLN